MTHTPGLQITTRVERFNGIVEGYEAQGADRTVPGAGLTGDRYAVITESSRGYGYAVNWATDLQAVESVSAANLHEGWHPVAYYDLDTLDGDEPDPQFGDIVLHNGRKYRVTAEPLGPITDYTLFDLEDEDELDAPLNRITLLERGPEFEDDRNPVRYLVAAVRIVVAFNTEPAHRA